MTVSRTSPDGDDTIERVEVGGRGYDLPPWLTEAQLREGMASGDDENPLASLTGCELSWWEDAGPGWFPVFALEWFVPFGGLRELAVNVFTPQAPEHGWRSNMFQVEFTELGAIVRGYGSEYRDFNDVQAFLIPGDVKSFQYAADRDESWLAELLEEYQHDPAEFEREVSGWDGLVMRHEFNGVNYTLVIKVHED